MMKAVTKIILGQPSWRLASTSVEAYVTVQGGHLGPVTFDRKRSRIQPYAVAPWAEEISDPPLPPIIQALRGDFFCMPFGGNATPFRGERHPIHGETANAPWTFESQSQKGETTRLHLSLKTRIRKGRVDKVISLVNGHDAVYCQDVVSGMEGPMSWGHHATLQFPPQPGSGVISTSPFAYGQVYPEPAELPEKHGYSFLKPGAVFTTLNKVPTITGEITDLSRYPARRGYEDIAMVVSDPDVPFAWAAVTFPRQRYVWFSLKDPRVLRGTVLWMSNGGRHYPPWNGRHVGVMGLEDVTSYFHPGLAESARANPLSEHGYATCAHLRPDRPLVVNYIMGVTRVPAGFHSVAAIENDPAHDMITLRAANGKFATIPLDLAFLGAGSLAG